MHEILLVVWLISLSDLSMILVKGIPPYGLSEDNKASLQIFELSSTFEKKIKLIREKKIKKST